MLSKTVFLIVAIDLQINAISLLDSNLSFKLVDNSVSVLIQEATKTEDTVTEDILRTFRISLQKYIWMLESMQDY